MYIENLKDSNRRLYNAIYKGFMLNINKGYRMYDSRKISDKEFKELTINDLFDIFTETEIRSWRNLGSKGYEQLLSLRG